MLLIVPVFAQFKHPHAARKKHLPLSDQLKDFYHYCAQANVEFTFPKGFKEIALSDDSDFSFDYALEMPGKNFEVWFYVASQQENFTSFQHSQNNPSTRVQNPDSTYMANASSLAIMLTGDKNLFERSIPHNVLMRYNADAGKSYLLTLQDLPETKHYKYALLITLQKNHIGTIVAVCFTNEKGPEFFKNIDKTSNCLKFKKVPPQ